MSLDNNAFVDCCIVVVIVNPNALIDVTGFITDFFRLIILMLRHIKNDD